MRLFCVPSFSVSKMCIFIRFFVFVTFYRRKQLSNVIKMRIAQMFTINHYATETRSARRSQTASAPMGSLFAKLLRSRNESCAIATFSASYERLQYFLRTVEINWHISPLPVLFIHDSKFHSKKMDIVLVGLENSGKTTLVNTLAMGEQTGTTPTVGRLRILVHAVQMNEHLFSLS